MSNDPADESAPQSEGRQPIRLVGLDQTPSLYPTVKGCRGPPRMDVRITGSSGFVAPTVPTRNGDIEQLSQ
jgi:hypothetical protein